MMRPANQKMIKQEAGNGTGESATPKMKKAPVVAPLQQEKPSVKKIKVQSSQSMPVQPTISLISGTSMIISAAAQLAHD